MIPHLYSRRAYCICCNTLFDFDVRHVKYQPKMCEPCKLQRRKAAARAHVRKRQTDAESCGWDSRTMGMRLKDLTIRTHREVGEILGITAEASRTAERSALAKIRKAFKLRLLNLQLDNSLRTQK
jgi:hypothetical protein